MPWSETLLSFKNHEGEKKSHESNAKQQRSLTPKTLIDLLPGNILEDMQTVEQTDAPQQGANTDRRSGVD